MSKGQKITIAKVLGGLQLASDEIIKAIQASETVLSAHLDRQDAEIERANDMLSLIPAEIQGSRTRVLDCLDAQDTSARQSETKVIGRFDAQDLMLKGAAHKQDAQTSFLQDHSHDALRVRVLDGLAFPEMNERRNMIEGRVGDFGDTYDWIFSSPEDVKSRTAGLHQHNFVEWLRNGKEVFWINGKPGSGKSSLMDYIYQDIQARRAGFDHLTAWAGSTPVQLLSFWFFRPASSRALKSLAGFWRSMCFQIFDVDKKLVAKIQAKDSEPVPESLKSCLAESGSRIRSWTDGELRSWFTYLLTHSDYKYCILIDGLDEVTNQRQPLLEAIRTIARISTRAKICCSSRPEAHFQQALCHYPSLRLQDFNYRDIENDCRRKLDETRAAPYVNEIAYRAEGVFLWACLVAEDLRSAAYQGDAEEDLNLRLEECPAEMNELFTFLLERQDKFYAKYPKPYLFLLDVAAKNGESVTLLQLLLASEKQDFLLSDFPNNLDDYLASLNPAAVNLDANIAARYAGLVECFERPLRRESELPSTFPHEALRKVYGIGACFIHRSAQDFLVDSEKGASLLQSCGISGQDALRRLMAASAVQFLLEDQERSLHTPLTWARLIEPASWTHLETSVVDSLFSTLQARRPLLMPSLPSKDNSQDDDVHCICWIVCPQLSTLENLTFAHTVEQQLIAYLQAKLNSLDSEKLHLVAAYAACLRCCNGSIPPDGDFVKKLPYLPRAQDLILWYNEATIPWRRPIPPPCNPPCVVPRLLRSNQQLLQ